MRILFCKISSMKYYKGVVPGKDEPFNGGSYVDEHGEGHEQYNFDAVLCNDGNEYCFGFVETKTTRANKRNVLHIENIDGCESMKNEPFVDDILVVWCATTDLNETSIVGWYKNATVFRKYEEIEFGPDYVQSYNVLAEKDDVVLLPVGERHRFIWNAPVSKKRGYGFGQSMIWYAQEEAAQNYVEKIASQILNYCGENWIDRSVDSF